MGATSLLLIAVAAAPQVEVLTLQGAKHAGALQELTAETATIAGAKGTVNLPTAQLMTVSFPKAPAAKPDPKSVVVTLTDGTHIRCAAFTTTSRLAKIESAAFGKFSVPLSTIAFVRFAAPDTTLDPKWKELCDRKIKKDYLVIPKSPALSHLDGVVGRISADKVQFTLGTNSVPVERSRVFGIIYFRANTPQPTAKAVCKADMADGDSLQLASIRWDGTKVAGRLRGGTRIEIPVASLKTLDFSLGKVQYLSAMEPREAKFKSFYSDPLDEPLFRYRRDRAMLGGQQLQLARKKYSRGLWIHSRTFLKYRLSKDYRRFRAVMGIDDNAGGVGDVLVVISGDGKTLLKTDVRSGDKPRKLDIDVTGVRELSILVDYGRDEDPTSDHLVLAEARIVK